MDHARTADAHGDPFIMAPELLIGGRASVASDVYSVACTLYAILAGRSPFDGIKTKSDLDAAIIRGSYPALRDIAPHVSWALADKVRIGMARTTCCSLGCISTDAAKLANRATDVTLTRRYGLGVGVYGELCGFRVDRKFLA